ncbi:MAG: 1-deoxy-D-xylulose-5-phosphate reductoisomerase, partial [Verrucomicrobiota bacterium]|nr:1-deoxy-D-xylulose-5-phosphate reductoisomerase [Verrucomicrobiota bacterium]
DFRPVDLARYPLLRLAQDCMRAGGTAPAIFNAANEVAVAAFLAGRIPFLAIPRLVEHGLSRVKTIEPNSLAEVLTVDQEARAIVTTHLPSVA